MSHGADVASALRKVELFSDLSEDELVALANVCRTEHRAAGETIISEGDSSARFYLIHSGEVDVMRDGAPAARMGPNDYFGEISVLDGKGRTATVVAVTDVDGSSLASFNVRALLRDHPEISYKLLVRLCARLRRAESDGT
jgi:CRP-like cAMP-binding protein